ncbi:MAG: class I lanthipeptide [Bacteroidota bacterium]
MKKLKISKKLSLNKETLSSLDKSEMMNVKGGFISIISCRTRQNNDGCSGCQTCCPTVGWGCDNKM